CLQYSGSPYSF
nr:immunoglobulin light chain junction region [Macaca mulatta]MOW52587.1 immunoglobulin light chain junction region [Macaca mulatta]MOW53400.1 immunoglobulin light chain junction region [Macaca mulatta]MOW53462.1 immunoglobulin light chain junction region [Macaca mulatta]MOW53613.1 immunoglobulin light chain junction region [Macaca mulatta]